MNKQDKIYVAGHRGLVGSTILKALKTAGYQHLVTRSHDALDLCHQQSVMDFFREERPDVVFLAAAKVGGIAANNEFRADFIYQNLQLQNNVIHQSYSHGVKKLLFLGSSCVYPKETAQPIPENALLTGALEYTNEPYAIAKIAGMRMCESYNLQYETNFLAVMPSNLYGSTADNFDLHSSHVLPALMRKFHSAKMLAENDTAGILRDWQTTDFQHAEAQLKASGVTADRVEIWGTGKPRREFLHVEDLADACIFIMENLDFKDLCGQDTAVRNTHLNVGTGTEVSIGDLARLIKDVVGYRGEIYFNAEKPDGTFRKVMDVSTLTGLGWQAKITLEAGLKRLYSDYKTLA